MGCPLEVGTLSKTLSPISFSYRVQYFLYHHHYDSRNKSNAEHRPLQGSPNKIHRVPTVLTISLHVVGGIPNLSLPSVYTHTIQISIFVYSIELAIVGPANADMRRIRDLPAGDFFFGAAHHQVGLVALGHLPHDQSRAPAFADQHVRSTRPWIKNQWSWRRRRRK